MIRLPLFVRKTFRGADEGSHGNRKEWVSDFVALRLQQVVPDVCGHAP